MDVHLDIPLDPHDDRAGGNGLDSSYGYGGAGRADVAGGDDGNANRREGTVLA